MLEWQILWWHWVVLAFVLILAELVIPSMVLIWFGMGALVTALFAALSVDDLRWQLLILGVSSVVMTVLWFKVFRADKHVTLVGTSAGNIVGEVGMLAQNVAPFYNGKVRFQKPIVGSDLWECMSDEEIKSGERVRVTEVHGSIVKIEKLVKGA